jgi:iron complex outermembrane receptor protein
MRARPIARRLATGVRLPLLLALFPAAAALADPPEQAPRKPAEEQETEPLDAGLEEAVDVVETPLFEGQRIDRFANPVTRVSHEQIDQLNAQDLASALRRVPGVVISRYNPVGSYGGGEGGGVYIRGHGGSRPGAEILTMVDGIPKFVGVWTHPLLDSLSVDLAGHVEIHKGPQPVQYGNMSFGVVDLQPKHRREPGRSQRVRAGYGSFDTAVGRYERGTRHGDLDTYLAASFRRSDGDRDRAGGEVGALYARAGLQLGPRWNASAMVDLSDGWAEDPGRMDAPSPDVTPRFEIRDRMTIATLAHEHARWSGELKLYYDDGAIEWRQWDADDGAGFFTLTDWENYGVRLRERRSLPGGGQLELGFDQDSYGGRAREERTSGPTPLGDFRFQNRALWARLSQPLGNDGRLTPSVGVRYNDSRYFGEDWGTHAGVVYRTPRGELYGRYASGYNLPGVWSAVLLQSTFGLGEAWQDLEAEEIDHFEVGWSWRLGGSRAVLDMALFRSDVENGLRFVPPPPPPPTFDNVGDYTSQGAEVSLTLSPGAGVELMLAAAYNETDPETIPFSPEWTFSGGLSARLAPRWRLHLDAEWLDERFAGNPRFPAQGERVGAFFLLNGQLVWAPSPGASGPKVFLAFENLLDADYAFRPGYPMPGTTLMAGIDWQFGS